MRAVAGRFGRIWEKGRMELGRTLKYHLYARWFGRASWNAAYQFDRACARLRPGDVVIDAGANMGDITARMAERGAVVHAFEPDPFACEALERRFAGVANVHLHRKAVAATSGTLRLYRSPDFDADPVLLSQSSSIYATKKNVSVDHAIDIETVDIAAFVRGLAAPVRIFKLDVEGAEVEVLEAIFAAGPDGPDRAAFRRDP